MLGYNKIPCRTAHGYVISDSETVQTKHDWIEVKINGNNKWITNEHLFFTSIEKRGNNVW